jgi:hypothetical protein
MASTKTDITGRITRGNDADLKFTITTSRPIVRAQLIIKRQAKDQDGAAIINKQVTAATGNPNGQIIAEGGSGAPAVIRFRLTKTETNNFVAAIDYQYDMEGFDSTSIATTPVGGVFRLEERVRTAIG